MIIECEECNTKYRFDEFLIDDEGMWVRCSFCGNVFFQKKIGEDIIIGTSEEKLWEKTGEEGTDNTDIKEIGDIKKILDEIDSNDDGHTYGNKDAVAATNDNVMTANTGEVQNDRVFWTTWKKIVYIIIIALVMGGAYLWFSPQIRIKIYDKTQSILKMKRYFQDKNNTEMNINILKQKINFTDVKEHFMRNWIIGNVMIIQGIAVNKDVHPVSGIKVKTKMFGPSGNIFAHTDSYAGNVLTYEELSNLTDEEIRKELSNPYGRDFPNSNIPNEGKIPFMVVFTNPNQEASEFVIELAKIDIIKN